MTTANVFINCPFDDEFAPLFEALLFTVLACGYNPRCALETKDASSIRLAKILEIIDDCDRSIHDLSRTQVGANGLPRFNMPFELGLMMGAKHFGGKRGARKSALVMIGEQYSLPKYISDLGGNDPDHHQEKPENVVGIVRSYLDVRPSGGPSPGKKMIQSALSQFKVDLPDKASAAKIEQSELNILHSYPNYVFFMAEYLRNNPVV